ncbi:uncharacterized protein PAC_07027 [Phialocephala subalpina]|uniref:Uncharacterized protein n=1 Tax=Phialocephala subalpina TaxID=576137 RepID=A0A1L7WWI4_9HELO|nr:uncharacterized protein PAC_07027 [Phialocephala subalpina]
MPYGVYSSSILVKKDIEPRSTTWTDILSEITSLSLSYRRPFCSTTVKRPVLESKLVLGTKYDENAKVYREASAAQNTVFQTTVIDLSSSLVAAWREWFLLCLNNSCCIGYLWLKDNYGFSICPKDRDTKNTRLVQGLCGQFLSSVSSSSSLSKSTMPFGRIQQQHTILARSIQVRAVKSITSFQIRDSPVRVPSKKFLAARP